MIPFLFTLAQFVLVVLLSPLTVGIIRRVKARFQNRRGASIFLPYWQMASLCRKEMTITRHRTWMFRAVPFVVLAMAFALVLLVPLLMIDGTVAGYSTIFFTASILAIGALFLVFGGMDVSSTFGAMGSSREMTLAALVEPVTITIFVTLGVAAGAWQWDGIMRTFLMHPWYVASPFLIITLIALMFVVLTENARYPVDNPATHLELTMVHEAMVLEYSGPYLAMLEFGSAIKLTVLSVLFMNILLPFGLITSGATVTAWLIGVGALMLKLVFASFFVAAIESLFVKMRFYRMQEFMSLAFLFAAVGLALTLVLHQ